MYYRHYNINLMYFVFSFGALCHRSAGVSRIKNFSKYISLRVDSIGSFFIYENFFIFPLLLPIITQIKYYSRFALWRLSPAEKAKIQNI